MVGPARPLFVLFGSSIVQMSYDVGGWGAILADIYSRRADILVRGYFGWNSRRAVNVLDQVFPKDAAVKPSLVIVYFGGNDSMGPHPSGLGPHVPLPEYVENMRKIAIHLKVSTHTPLASDGDTGTPSWTASGTPPLVSRPSLRDIQMQQGKQHQSVSHSPKTKTTGFSVTSGQGSPLDTSGVNRWFKPEVDQPSPIRSIQIEE